MIVVPRLAKYGEHVNDHQLQILDVFTKEGYILSMKEGNSTDLEALIKTDFVPKKFVSNNKSFNEKLFDEIEKS